MDAKQDYEVPLFLATIFMKALVKMRVIMELMWLVIGIVGG